MIGAMAKSEYYCWEHPDAPFRVHLYWDVAERMQSEVVRSLSSFSHRRGPEVGGLLLGAADLQGNGAIEIRDFEPVRCEYRTGPCYRLSEVDERALEAALARRSRGPLFVVGWYRTHIRGPLELDEEDRALIERHFPAPGNVFLLIDPASMQQSKAAFFFRRAGRIQPESCPLEFPFGRTRGTSPAAKPSEFEIAPVTIARAQQPRNWFSGVAILILALCVLGLIFLTYGRRRSDIPLALQVERTGGDLKLMWDRDAAVLRSAKGAVLSIRDGDFERDVQMDPVQLHNGNLIYAPATREVLFRLEVLSQGEKNVSASVVVLTAPRPVPPLQAGLMTPAQEPAPPVASPPAARAEPAKRAAKPSPREFIPPPRAAEPLPQLDTPSMPAVTVQPNLSASVHGLPNMPPVTPPPVQPKAAPAVEPASPKPEQAPRLMAAEYVAPRPVQRVQPVVPQNVKSMITGAVQIEVRVSIDASGRVVGAQPVNSKGPLNAFVSGLAVNAARLWRFEPARRGAQAVSSETILRFEFAGPKT
jgi:hypothetical protein